LAETPERIKYGSKKQKIFFSHFTQFGFDGEIRKAGIFNQRYRRDVQINPIDCLVRTP
jgi:hypothetical protein